MVAAGGTGPQLGRQHDDAAEPGGHRHQVHGQRPHLEHGGIGGLRVPDHEVGRHHGGAAGETGQAPAPTGTRPAAQRQRQQQQPGRPQGEGAAEAAGRHQPGDAGVGHGRQALAAHLGRPQRHGGRGGRQPGDHGRTPPQPQRPAHHQPLDHQPADQHGRGHVAHPGGHRQHVVPASPGPARPGTRRRARARPASVSSGSGSRLSRHSASGGATNRRCGENAAVAAPGRTCCRLIATTAGVAPPRVGVRGVAGAPARGRHRQAGPGVASAAVTRMPPPTPAGRPGCSAGRPRCPSGRAAARAGGGAARAGPPARPRTGAGCGGAGAASPPPAPPRRPPQPRRPRGDRRRRPRRGPGGGPSRPHPTAAGRPPQPARAEARPLPPHPHARLRLARRWWPGAPGGP